MATTRRRLRSGAVILGGMGTLAAVLTSCGSEPDKRCVDPNSYQAGKGYKIVDNKRCGSSSGSGTSGTSGGSGGSTGKAGSKTGGTAKGGSGGGDWYYDGKASGSYVQGGTFDRKGFGSSGSGGG
ncbi:hypothetical protein [Streptomyces sp. URMC 123]|uniref:hypothetical protein n=1 Tax=Streptomyces sp. URMC 123 TaxID=3423403 RepID=UPI003F195298